MSDSEDDSSRTLLNKADEFLNRRRAQLGNAMPESSPAEIAGAADDIPLLTEVVSAGDIPSRQGERMDFSADIAREMDAWLDENLPQVVLHALDGISDRLIAKIHESARTDLLPRLKRAVGENDKPDEK